jgi:GNAT superfamily N-acetyltransferase
VAAFEADIARISFPGDPITNNAFHERRLAKFVDDPNAGAFVAESAGAVVGWALVTRRENFATKEQYGDFRSLYVLESHRRSPTAAALMSAVLDFCRSLKLAAVIGRTSYTNTAMKSIYAAYGFKPKHVVYELQFAEVSSDR